MSVYGDGKAHRPDGYRGLVPTDWPSIRRTSGWIPPDEITESGAQEAVRNLIATHTVFCGRYCYACSADLGDPGSPKSTSAAAYKAATGQYPDWTLSIPQGGHAPDCPVPYLLKWLGEGGSVYTRIRTVDIDDEAAKRFTSAKSPMELVGTDVEALDEGQRVEREAVLQAFGLRKQSA